MGRRVLAALGGNAILRYKQEGTPEEQLANVRSTCKKIVYHDGLSYKNIYYLNGFVNFARFRDMQTFSLTSAKFVYARNKA